jgi:hypothetical protein
MVKPKSEIPKVEERKGAEGYNKVQRKQFASADFFIG